MGSKAYGKNEQKEERKEVGGVSYMGKLSAGLAAFLAKKKGKTKTTKVSKNATVDKTEAKFPDSKFPLKKKGIKKGGK